MSGRQFQSDQRRSANGQKFDLVGGIFVADEVLAGIERRRPQGCRACRFLETDVDAPVGQRRGFQVDHDPAPVASLRDPLLGDGLRDLVETRARTIERAGPVKRNFEATRTRRLEPQPRQTVLAGRQLEAHQALERGIGERDHPFGTTIVVGEVGSGPVPPTGAPRARGAAAHGHRSHRRQNKERPPNRHVLGYRRIGRGNLKSRLRNHGRCRPRGGPDREILCSRIGTALVFAAPRFGARWPPPSSPLGLVLVRSGRCARATEAGRAPVPTPFGAPVYAPGVDLGSAA